jgi:hypothetical protein
MEQPKCLSCGYVNLPGDAACRECGAALTASNTAAVDVPAFVPPPSDTVVVERTGMSQSAIMATFLLGLVGLVIVGVLMYQWGKAEGQDEDLARARTERADRDVRPASTTTSTPTSAPVVTTSPAPAPIVVPVPAPPQPVYVPSSATSTSQSSGTRDAAVVTYVSTLDPLLGDWNDLLRTAETQTGDDLTQSLDRMRDVQRQITNLQAPTAAASVHGRLLTAMTAIVDALANGSPGGGFPTDSEAYRQATDLFKKFQTDYDTLKVTKA